MKKVCVLIITVLFLIILCACSNTEAEPELEYLRQDKNSVLKLSDGWYLYYEREEVYDSNGAFTQAYCSCDGVNLKYKNLTDFNIPLIDMNSGKVAGSVPPSVHFLKMNKIYEEKMKAIEKVLNSRPTVDNLTVEELKDVDISGLIFSLDDVVNVYNKAMSGGTKEFGKYMNISSSNIVSDTLLDGYQWQVGYFILSGHIVAIDIEVIYDDGRYLSDINENQLSDSQKELLQKIEDIRNNILANGNFLGSNLDFEEEFDEVNFTRLYKLLKSLEVENEKSLG